MYDSVIWRYTLDARAAAIQCSLDVFECSTQLILERYFFFAKAEKNRRNKDASGHVFPSKISYLGKHKLPINTNKCRFIAVCPSVFSTISIYLSPPSPSVFLAHTHTRALTQARSNAGFHVFSIIIKQSQNISILFDSLWQCDWQRVNRLRQSRMEKKAFGVYVSLLVSENFDWTFRCFMKSINPD